MGCGASTPGSASAADFTASGAGFPINSSNSTHSPKVAGTGSPAISNGRRICDVCKQEVGEDYVEALGKLFHTAHFKCGRCNKELNEEFFESEGMCICGECNASEMPCAKCALPILEEYITAGGKTYHVDCIGEPCGRCGKTVVESVVKALKQSWHPECFTCHMCQKGLKDGFSEFNKHLVCPECKHKALTEKYSSGAGLGASEAAHPPAAVTPASQTNGASNQLPPLREIRSSSYASFNNADNAADNRGLRKVFSASDSLDLPVVSPAMVGTSLPSSPQKPGLQRTTSSTGLPGATPYGDSRRAGQPPYSPMPNRRPSTDGENKQGDVSATTIAGSDASAGSGSGSGAPEAVQYTAPQPSSKSGLDFEILFEDLFMDLQIGSGAFGVVWKGRWRSQLVAIKMLPTHLMNKKEIRAFQSEAALMKNLRPSPNVVLLMGVCTDPERLCIVTEYLERGSLDKMLKEASKKGPLPNDVVLKIIRGVARGMNHLHFENIIHRDLAARNVLMSESFDPKISDFGMSRFSRDDINKTTNNVGPLRWMPPESIQDRLYSRYSDVWSYACLLIEIFTYEPPYPRMPILQFAMKLVSGEIQHVIPPNAPPFIQDIMRRCFSDQPEARGDFTMICEELDQVTSLY
eukprot:TRINITY_DN5813_c1_g1_i1.p1 TRINITY_DN5813_c1_g1~~TRINITY_DN5813_c1_g1_i1.p1  ORF type:complete len:635 (-),score=207.00 TRINITY_DN5813_c1_g1_i1:169-2073(-)